MKINFSRLNRFPDMNFRFAETDDAEFIWTLRQHGYKARHLSQVGDTVASQRKWLEKYKEREKQGTEYYFVISGSDGERYGLYRIYDIDEAAGTCQSGSWIFRDDSPANLAVRAEIMMKDLMFEELGIKTLYYDTRLKNKRIYTYSLLQNAELIRRDELNYYFKLTREQFRDGRKNLLEKFQIKL
jgi:hypothetical protein